MWTERLDKMAPGLYMYLNEFSLRRTRSGWVAVELAKTDGDAKLRGTFRTLRAAVRALGDEEVPTVNLMSGVEIKIPRRHKGTHMDPSQERYWTA